MKDEEILKKAIRKAIKGGFKQIAFGQNIKHRYKLRHFDKVEITLYELIFSHDFAKAFWGEKKVKEKTNYHRATKSVMGTQGYNKGDLVYTPIYHTAWKYHLKKMVLKKDPIKYLEKFL